MSPTGIIITAFIICLLILLLLVVSSLFFYRLAVYRQKKTFLADNPDLTQITTADTPVFDTVWLQTQPLEEVAIKSYDELLLKGFYLPAPAPTTKTVILAHGYTGSSRLNMGPFAQMYHEIFGFNVFMPDARGHGESEGHYIGFGWHDRLDYVKWIHTLIQRLGEDVQIVLHGISMGAATVLITSGEPLPEQVKCIVADCAYTSANDILGYQLKRMYKLPPFPFVPLTSLVCKLLAGYFFGEVSALKQVKKNKKPILFIHGAEDTFVPTEMIDHLYKQCNTYKEMLIIPGAGHGMAHATDTTRYTQQVKDFVIKFVS
jgi:uncharacterized protein